MTIEDQFTKYTGLTYQEVESVFSFVEDDEDLSDQFRNEDGELLDC